MKNEANHFISGVYIVFVLSLWLRSNQFQQKLALCFMLFVGTQKFHRADVGKGGGHVRFNLRNDMLELVLFDHLPPGRDADHPFEIASRHRREYALA